MKRKFIMANTTGRSMRNQLNEQGEKGWHFVKMEPFFQQQRMTASHSMSKFVVCVEENPRMSSYYRVRFIKGNSAGDCSFRVNDINDCNERMQKCGFDFIDYHHIITLHLHPKYNTGRSMKGYLCIWEMSLERAMVEKMQARINNVISKIETEIDISKLCGAPRVSRFEEIKDEAVKYRKKAEEQGIFNEKWGGEGCRLRNDELRVVEQADSYLNLLKIVGRVIELDNMELKKQMGKEWDEGLLDIEPDIEAVLDSLSYDFSIETLVKEILWSAQGNLITSSLENKLANE